MDFNFSTAALSGAERFDYWRDVICEHCIQAASNSSFKTAFEATVSGRAIGPLYIATMAAPEHSWTRRSEDIRRDPESGLWLSYMESGVGYLEQNGNTVVQNSGDVLLYDATKPFTYTLNPKSLFFVRIPRDLLSQRAASAERLVAISLGAGTGFKTILGHLIKEANQSIKLFDQPSAASWGGSAILDLLACIIDLHEGDKPKNHSEALYMRACAYISQNIYNPELCALDVAVAERVSLRTLARAFAVKETTPARHIWNMRLQASYRAIAEGSVRKVSEAAMNYGFSDFSHFSRAFKKSFGVSPHSLMLRR